MVSNQVTRTCGIKWTVQSTIVWSLSQSGSRWKVWDWMKDECPSLHALPNCFLWTLWKLWRKTSPLHPPLTKPVRWLLCGLVHRTNTQTASPRTHCMVSPAHLFLWTILNDKAGQGALWIRHWRKTRLGIRVRYWQSPHYGTDAVMMGTTRSCVSKKHKNRILTACCLPHICSCPVQCAVAAPGDKPSMEGKKFWEKPPFPELCLSLLQWKNKKCWHRGHGAIYRERCREISFCHRPFVRPER